MIYAVIIFSYLGIYLIDIKPILKKKRWKELTVILVLLATALTISLLLVFNVKLPSPLKGFMYLIRDVLGISFKK